MGQNEFLTIKSKLNWLSKRFPENCSKQFNFVRNKLRKCQPNKLSEGFVVHKSHAVLYKICCLLTRWEPYLFAGHVWVYVHTSCKTHIWLTQSLAQSASHMPHINILSDEIKLDGTLFGTPQKMYVISVQNLFLTKTELGGTLFPQTMAIWTSWEVPEKSSSQLSFSRNEFSNKKIKF